MQISALLLLTLLTQGDAEKGDPCRCARSKPSIERAFERADVVFVGKASSLDHAVGLEKPRRRSGPRIQRVEFEVTHIFKGGNAFTYDVYVDLLAPCAFQFVVPDVYIVYAWRAHVYEGHLTTNRCVRTDRITDAVQDMRILPERIFGPSDEKK